MLYKVLLFFCFIVFSLYPRDLNVSMAYLPQVLESTEEGTFALMVNALDSVYKEGEFKKALYPFARSLHNVSSGVYDFHIPLIINPLEKEEDLPYRYATCKQWNIVFIICSTKENPITMEDIQRAKNTTPFPYRITTDRAHLDFFDFPIAPASHVEGALKQVAANRVDAFIFAQVECDYVIKKMEPKYRRKIYRAPYGFFQGTIVVQKGPHGDMIDSLLTEAFKKAEAEGRLTLLDEIRRANMYKDWQTKE